MSSSTSSNTLEDTAPIVTINSAVLIHSDALVRALTDARMAPNYVGVRRVRQVNSGATAKSPATRITTSDVVYKITDANGKERRLTHQEKKAMKQKLAQEKKLAKKNRAKRSADEMQTNSATAAAAAASNSNNKAVDDTNKRQSPSKPLDDDEEDGNSQSDDKSSSVNDDQNGATATNKKYHQLAVNSTTIEDELTENRDKRSFSCPVLLSPAMALQAVNILSNAKYPTHPSATSSSFFIQYNAKLSKQWAQQIKEAMLPAETVRQAENMRPMAYQLTPEPWERLRPTTTSSEMEERFETQIHNQLWNECNDPYMTTAAQTENTISAEDAKLPPAGGRPWISVTCRSPNRLDLVKAIVFEYLYRHTRLHVSCGAKFGSDMLIYDGPREKRHAFAGLRVLLPFEKEDNNQQWRSTDDQPPPSLPLPTAYAMAGFVRGLNTAGKLALLATVVEETIETTMESTASDTPTTIYHLALVDVALEKILSAPTHRRNARTNKRRDVSQNLAKM